MKNFKYPLSKVVLIGGLILVPFLAWTEEVCCPAGTVAYCDGQCCPQACDSQGKCPSTCPDGGTIGKDGKTCCQNGWELNKETGKYEIWRTVPYVCPCPDGGLYFKQEDGSGLCCKDGKVYSINKDKGYITDDHYYCQGCPAGGTPSEKDSNVCCKDYNVYSYDKGDYIIDTEGLCDDCPDGGKYTTINKGDGTFSVGCCKDGYQQEIDGNYTKIAPWVCGCPSGSEYKKTKDGSEICCKNGRQFLTVYTTGAGSHNELRLNFGQAEKCGCPDGGTINPDCITRGVNCVCCKDGFGMGSDGKYDNIFANTCGCPYDGTLASDNATCCKDGLAYVTGVGYIGEEEVCQQQTTSCPDGEDSYKGTCCYHEDLDCVCTADPDNEICKDLVDITRQVQQGCDGNPSMWCLRT